MAGYLGSGEVGHVDGPVVAIDVVRAFSTAAYAFAAGAAQILLVETLDEAYRLLDTNPTWLAMGEDRGRRPDRFALSNSPVRAAQADLDGRTIVQRTSAGTRGAVAARRADPLLCASLVVAAATAAYLNRVAPGVAPTYVITGRFPDVPGSGDEDVAAAEHIELLRGVGRGEAPASAVAGSMAEAVRRVVASPDAATTLALGAEHVDQHDVEHCVDVDRFAFAMVARRTAGGLVLRAVQP